MAHELLIHKKDRFSIFIILFSIAFAVAMYLVLPEQVVSHWTADGTPAGVSSKEVIVLGFPTLLFVLFFALSVLPYVDLFKPEYELIHHEYTKFKTAIMLFFLYVFIAISLTNTTFIPFTITLPKLLIPGVSILVYYLAIAMPRVKQNLLLGVRTPWTLKHEKVWTATHVKAGKLFKAASIVIMLSVFLPTAWALTITIAALLFSTAYLVIYSYAQHSKQLKNKPFDRKKNKKEKEIKKKTTTLKRGK